MVPIQKPMLTMRSGRGLLFTCLLATCLASFEAGSAVGQTLWPENGHYYLIVNQTTTWQQAQLLAEAMVFMGVQGHLATITSEAENTFVTTQLGDTTGAWLGGEQLPDSEEPAGGWQWITGEPWVYTNWDVGEPNDTYGGGWGKEATGQSEERLHYHHNGTHWNDLPDDPEVVTPRFIVEWDISTKEEEVLRARLSGFQENPDLSTAARGTFRATVRDEATIEYTLRYEQIEGGTVTVAHIHFGKVGVNGGVIAFLCGGGDKPACPQTAGTVKGVIAAADIIGPEDQGISPGELAEVLRAIRVGSTYVNVHSAPTYPAGEIRGQIKRRVKIVE